MSDVGYPAAQSNPLVSICLPTLNARRFLEPRMASILSQTLTDWELIVCDSYSDDGTWEYLQGFRDDARIRLYQVPKEGLYAGWNACLRRARGEYIYIATADDTCEPELLGKMVGGLEGEGVQTADHRQQTADYRPQSKVHSLASNVLHADPQRELPCLPADIAVCNFEYIDEAGAVVAPPLPPAGAFYGDARYQAHRRSGYLEFLVHLLIGTSWTTMTAVVFRRALLEKTGLFPEDVPGALADRLWAYRSALYSDTLVVPETLATWRQHSDQASAPGTGVRTLRHMHRRRALWRAIQQTVRDCMPLLPAHWQQDPQLLEKLLWAERRHYYDLYHLDRTSLRYKPRGFLLGLGMALCLEPVYAVRRILGMLRWEDDTGLAESAYLHRLLPELPV
jgi:hypothetical protein